jgi:multidrug efflux pump
MLSRFFIDRPIFATVLSLCITLVGGIALSSLPIAQYPRITPPGVAVSISYPGANAQVVAETVAAPIEQQVTGIPGMLYMSSQSGNDGSYSLSCTFDVNTNLDAALVMVQNRVTLAMPLLPTAVQQQGITIRKKTPDILMIVSFTSPGGRYDDVYLSNYFLINVRDELLRVPGVSDINILGERDYSIRVWLDPQKLASRSMTGADVANAVRAQNIEVALGQLGQAPMDRKDAFQLPIDTLGRLSDPAQFGDIIVKAGANQAAATSGNAGSSGSGGLPSSGITDPLAAAYTKGLAATATSNSADSATAGSSTAGSSAASDASANATAGTAAAGVQAGGGGTTGGGGTAAVTMPANSLAVGGANSTGQSNGQLSATTSGGTQPPTTAIVRLRDVARVEMGALNYSQAVYFDGLPSVGLSVYQLPGTNALDVADRVRARIAELSTRFPEDVAYTIGYDTTPFVRESIGEVFKTLRDAILLVALVVLLFLQDWKAMILPMIDVPVSLIGTFAVMAVLGYSLNNISLFGLVLAIGIVVDDAIVVLENIERQMAQGHDPRTATLKAMEEITGPIIAITLVLSAVFVPCAFISGITGRFYQQFAVTIAASTIISAINALTMTPSRALLILRSGGMSGAHGHRREALPWWIFGIFGGWLTLAQGPSLVPASLHLPVPGSAAAAALPGGLAWLVTPAWFAPGALGGLVFGWFCIRPINVALAWVFARFNDFFEKLTSAYGWTIGKAMRLAPVVLILYVGTLALTGWVFQIAPSGFVPEQDMGRCLAGVQLPDSASLERTKDVMRQIEKIARETEGVDHTISICGTSFVQQANGTNFGSLFIVLKPFDERQHPDLKDTAIMAKLRKRWVHEVQEAQVVVFGAAPIPGISVAGGFKVIIEDRGGTGVRPLQEQTDTLIGKLRDAPGLVGVSTQFRSGIPQLYLDVDRDKAAALGLSPEDVNQALQIFLGSSYVNSFNEFGRYWQVTLQAEGKFRSRISDINLLKVRNKWGQMVPIGTLVQAREITGPVFINRYNLYTAAPITGSLRAGVSTGDVIDEVNQRAQEVLPRSMKADWTELMFLQILEGSSTPPQAVFALSVLFVFLTLAALYESWSLPLAVILVVPLCVLCAITGVLISHSSVNIFVQIGLIVLVGLACKNAILVVEFAREKHASGLALLEATQDASRLRLRPILMTSFAFILGVLPLVYASGAGAEMRRSLGTAVFSGMLGVTVFGVFLTPVFFYVIQKLGETKRLPAPLVRHILSGAAGGLLGLGGGYLVGRLGLFPLAWAVPLGCCAGILAVFAVLGIHGRFRAANDDGGKP